MWDIMLKHPSDQKRCVGSARGLRWERVMRTEKICRSYSETERDADLERFGGNPGEKIWAVEV